MRDALGPCLRRTDVCRASSRTKDGHGGNQRTGVRREPRSPTHPTCALAHARVRAAPAGTMRRGHAFCCRQKVPALDSEHSELPLCSLYVPCLPLALHLRLRIESGMHASRLFQPQANWGRNTHCRRVVCLPVTSIWAKWRRRRGRTRRSQASRPTPAPAPAAPHLHRRPQPQTDTNTNTHTYAQGERGGLRAPAPEHSVILCPHCGKITHPAV